MDMTKTPAFRAVEELVRAQNTHMKLRREFEEAKLSEDIAEMKEVRHCICACMHTANSLLVRPELNQKLFKLSMRIEIFLLGAVA